MRTRWIAAPITVLAAFLGAACATEHPAVARPSGPVGVLAADARALRYGASAPEVFDNPKMRDKVRALFGSDWGAAAQGGGRLEHGALAYFPPDSSIRLLRIGDQEYIA